MKSSKQRLTVGWREKLALPALGLDEIYAKVDTGAKTSCLHAFEVESYEEEGVNMLRFLMHPLHKSNEQIVECRAPVHDVRDVTDSGGHTEQRFVILTPLELKGVRWDIEITLTNRDTMAFRMLLGRSAMRGKLLVDPGKSFLTSTESE